jgi:putative transposase
MLGRHMSYISLLTHIIFSSKDRHHLIDEPLRTRLFQYMGGIITDMAAKPIIINGPANHVHILASMPAKISVSDFMRTVKANSSRWVHENFSETFEWQKGYGAFSVSPSQARTVENYIAGQVEHHKRVTFEEEFISFLKRHGVEYDERYIWN